ncbi:MAG: HNH endonuclease family protein [Planctomycetaceae bacterium]|nr:HNH endonuclease family protein [Planctomycetaceae bacterium]
MQLSEGDIFKAELFEQAAKERKDGEFSEIWDRVVANLGGDTTDEDGDAKRRNAVKQLLDSKQPGKPYSAMTELFRVYMHVLRAQHEVTYDTVGLRDFFLRGTNLGKSKIERLKDDEEKEKIENGDWHQIGGKDKKFTWDKVMKDIESLSVVVSQFFGEEDKDPYPALTNWLTAIQRLKKRDGIIPLLVWLFGNAIGKDGKIIELSSEKVKEGIHFFREIARLSFVNSGTSKRQIFAASAAALGHLPWSYDNDVERKRIEIEIRKKSSRNAMVYLLELLLHGGDDAGFVPLGEIEHILPKNYGGTRDGWTPAQKEEAKGQLGNLVMLEKGPNIRASDAVWTDKKEKYNGSEYEAVKKLLTIPQWTYDAFKYRQKECEYRIIEFLEGK